MKEVAFLSRNAQKWKQFETLLADPGKGDPDRLADLYVELTDDLSYARTFFPGSKTVTYLNGLAGRVHQRVYRNRREEKGRIVGFWKTEVPMLMYRHRRMLLYAFIVVAISAAVGVLSTLNDAGYIRLILGDAYVDETLANIRRGDPMGIYKSEGSLSMFLWLPLHNIKVALNTFAFGITASVGTVLMLIQNGLMIGAFHTFFFQHGQLGASLLAVWLHGTIEISSIVVAGAAGLVMGNGILFPGTYTRLQSFRRGAIDGLKIVLGTVPFFVVAGFIESFVTRHTGMPAVVNMIIILVSLAVIIGYFVVYPAHLHRSREHGSA